MKLTNRRLADLAELAGYKSAEAFTRAFTSSSVSRPPSSAIAPEADVGVQRIGGGEYAVTTHRGSFDGLRASYGWLAGEFLERCGRVPRKAPALELYLTPPVGTPDADRITDLALPLEPADARDPSHTNPRE